jgi:succinate dehydrogenase / fumarate reductase iron-sulfur subunit
MTVLDALFYIQDHYDSSLAFRYACRGSICGSCGMTIDKLPQLACRTQITAIKMMEKPKNIPMYDFGEISDWNQESEILIEPLPNLKVLKDLVVDMQPFWDRYRQIQPFFARAWKDTIPESSQEPQDAKLIEHLIYCILCGVCWACPVNATNPNYIGPAALAKSYRFIGDTRLSEENRDDILEKAWDTNGVPSCEKFFVCNRVCPKGVLPGNAINDIRTKWPKNEGWISKRKRFPWRNGYPRRSLLGN